MKKIVFVLFLMLLSYSYAREETPLLLDTPINSIEYIEDDSILINTDNMKKSKDIKRVQNELNQNQKRKIKLDTRQINHQRALDYTTKFNDTMMLPVF